MGTPISIRLDEELESQLKATSKRLNRSRSFVVKSALEQYFAEYVDYQIALDRLNNKDDAILTAAEFRAGYEG